MYMVNSVASIARIMEECGCVPDVALDIQTDRLNVAVDSNTDRGRKPIFMTGSPEQGITIIFED